MPDGKIDLFLAVFERKPNSDSDYPTGLCARPGGKGAIED
jgi:hypothetical protein